MFFVCLLPFFYLIHGIFNSSLGADPQKEILLNLGEWALRFLLATLMVSIFRRRLGMKSAIKYRRMLGLFAMFYASLHLLAYYVFYLGLSFDDLASELIERPYLIVGFSAWCILIPLTLTSTKSAMRWLGSRWQKLHYLVYIAVFLAWVHFFMQVKSDINEPLTYAVILFLIAFERILFWRKKRAQRKH